MSVFPQNVSEQEGRCKKDNLVSQEDSFLTGNCDITELIILSQTVEGPCSVQRMLLPAQIKLLRHSSRNSQALKTWKLRKQSEHQVTVSPEYYVYL